MNPVSHITIVDHFTFWPLWLLAMRFHPSPDCNLQVSVKDRPASEEIWCIHHVVGTTQTTGWTAPWHCEVRRNASLASTWYRQSSRDQVGKLVDPFSERVSSFLTVHKHLLGCLIIITITLFITSQSERYDNKPTRRIAVHYMTQVRSTRRYVKCRISSNTADWSTWI